MLFATLTGISLSIIPIRNRYTTDMKNCLQSLKITSLSICSAKLDSNWLTGALDDDTICIKKLGIYVGDSSSPLLFWSQKMLSVVSKLNRLQLWVALYTWTPEHEAAILRYQLIITMENWRWIGVSLHVQKVL